MDQSDLDFPVDSLFKRIKRLESELEQEKAENIRLVNRLRNRNIYVFSHEMGRVKVSEQMLKMGYLLTADNVIIKR